MQRLTRKLDNGDVHLGICFNAEIDPNLTMYDQYDLMCEKLYAYEEAGIEPEDVLKLRKAYAELLMLTVLQIGCKVLSRGMETKGDEPDNT